jgi:hypothetical protein
MSCWDGRKILIDMVFPSLVLLVFVFTVALVLKVWTGVVFNQASVTALRSVTYGPSYQYSILYGLDLTKVISEFKICTLLTTGNQTALNSNPYILYVSKDSFITLE